MGPPRERDGEPWLYDRKERRKVSLQWGRRVNATESTDQTRKVIQCQSLLQWGRRVNATESR